MEEDFVVKVMAVRVEKAKHDDDDDDAITANDASNAVVTTALRLMNMAVGLSRIEKNLVNGSPAQSLVLSLGFVFNTRRNVVVSDIVIQA
jgi:hypothetical protein